MRYSLPRCAASMSAMPASTSAIWRLVIWGVAVGSGSIPGNVGCIGRLRYFNWVGGIMCMVWVSCIILICIASFLRRHRTGQWIVLCENCCYYTILALLEKNGRYQEQD